MYKSQIQHRLKQKAIKRINAACIVQAAFRNTTQCVICLQLVQKNPNCCHTFHNSCSKKWVSTGKLTCPTCRGYISVSLNQKLRYFMDSNKRLKQLKQSIEIFDPNYFDNEEFRRWERKILLSDYYIHIINNRLKTSDKTAHSSDPLYIKNFNRIDTVMETTTSLIEELTEDLEELEELEKISLSEDLREKYYSQY